MKQGNEQFKHSYTTQCNPPKAISTKMGLKNYFTHEAMKLTVLTLSHHLMLSPKLKSTKVELKNFFSSTYIINNKNISTYITTKRQQQARNNKNEILEFKINGR